MGSAKVKLAHARQTMSLRSTSEDDWPLDEHIVYSLSNSIDNW